MDKGFVAILFLALLLGCGKPDINPDQSIVTLNLSNDSFRQFEEALPRSTAGTTLETNFIVVNVTGPGIQDRIYFSWNRCRSFNCTDVIPPTSINLEVPSGSDRLIQVMAVRDSDSNHNWSELSDASVDPSLHFGSNQDIFYVYYGEQMVNMNTPQMDVPINLNPISPVGHESKEIMGRFLTTPSSGPTGEVGVYFTAPGRNDEFLVETMDIINGWGEFFTANGLRLIYRMMADNQLVLDTHTLQTSKHMMAVKSPKAYGKYQSSAPPPHNNTSIHPIGHNSTTLYGFFGPGVTSNHAVCYPSIDGAEVKNINTGTYSSGHFIHDGTNYLPLQWFGASSNPQHLSRYGGGVDMSTDVAICSTANELSSAFIFDYKKFGGHEGSAVNFSVPYRLPRFTSADTSVYNIWDATHSSQFILSKMVPNTTNSSDFDVYLWWEYLNGTLPDIQGTTVFYGRKSLLGDGDNECHIMKDDSRYYRKDFPVSSNTYIYKDQFLGTFPGSYFDTTSNDYIQAFICPYYNDLDGNRKYMAETHFWAEIRQHGNANLCSSILSMSIPSGGFNQVSVDYLKCSLQQGLLGFSDTWTPSGISSSDVFLFYSDATAGNPPFISVLQVTNTPSMSTTVIFKTYNASDSMNLLELHDQSTGQTLGTVYLNLTNSDTSPSTFPQSSIRYNGSGNFELDNITKYKKLSQ